MKIIPSTLLPLLALILAGCGETELYPPRDTTEEKEAFFEQRTEVVIEEQEALRDKLIQELDELPEDASEDKRREIKEKLANVHRRLA
ncbi:MAG: hypothetical protein R3242_04145, partial [Akkermansiaceae bacterium]|nr:hypothetical protein [Akkermansiaceae bacterium]